MPRCHVVRIGAMAELGRFVAIDATHYPRGTRVIVRTGRGLEVGEVLAPPDDESGDEASDGALLRGMTDADELLAQRLNARRDEALSACQRRLADLAPSAVLLDAEPLFDGGGLVFYYLGQPASQLNELSDALTEVYESIAQTREFAKLLDEGCGPGCGTEAATGGGCSTCSVSCAVASVCVTRKH